MAEVALRVQHLAKQYVIGKKREHDTLRDAVVGALGKGRRFLASGKRERENRSVWALRDVSFEVQRGEAVGIIGRNGAGKSTLLKMLSRVTQPTKGRAEIYGRIGCLLEVGTGFHPELTGRDNIYLNGAILGMSKAEIRTSFDAIVDFSGVDKFLDTPVKRYSSGMHARLAFAVAAHLNPDILIVDEVLAVGDAAFQRKCLGKMSDIASEGRTVLFVSHNMGVMQSLCRRGIVLSEGVVVCDDTADRAAAVYLNQLESASTEKLSERTDRSGQGHVRLHEIEISSNSDGAVLAAGAPLRIRLVMNNPCHEPMCSMTVYDQMGFPVTHLTSRIRSNIDGENGSPLEFICEMDELFLVPGRYRLAVALFSNGDLQDHLSAAAHFDVEHGILRGRPVQDQGVHGRVAFPHRWIVPCHD